MLDYQTLLKQYLEKPDMYSISLSSFQVFPGSKKDLIKEICITDTLIFNNTIKALCTVSTKHSIIPDRIG